MAVKLRLMRMGKKKHPTYRVVAADARSPRDGRFIELIGRYDPHHEPSVVEIDNERANYWLGVGAQPTEAVRKLLEISGAWTQFAMARGDIHVVDPVVPPEPKDRKSEKAREATAEEEAAVEETDAAAPETDAVGEELEEAAADTEKAAETAQVAEEPGMGEPAQAGAAQGEEAADQPSAAEEPAADGADTKADSNEEAQ